MSAADLPPAVLYLVLEWTIRIGALIAVPFRRSPDSARTWLLLMFFLPVPGLLLYLLIGRPTYPRRRKERLARARELLDDAAREIAHSKACRRPQLSPNFSQAARLIESVGRFPALGGNSIALNSDYEGVVDALIADIDGAQDHVHILMYIFADDEVGTRVIDALSRASALGVTCRVLIDAIGSRPWAQNVLERLRAAGVEADTALPVAPWRRGSARADLRNHRKIAIVDGKIAYVGSQNVIRAEAAKNIFNEELVARVAGPVVVELETVFAVDWFLETDEILSGPQYFRHLPGAGTTTAQVMPSGPDYGEEGLGQLTVALVHAARERVVITTPYFIPDTAVLLALRTAASRGVTVQLIVPHISDNRFVQLAQQSYYSELLEADVKVYLYRGRFLHSKHLSIDDDIVLIGSSNIDVRSFVLNAEITLISYDRDVALSLRSEQERCLAASVRLKEAEWAARPPATKLAENLARLISPLL